MTSLLTAAPAPRPRDLRHPLRSAALTTVAGAVAILALAAADYPLRAMVGEGHPSPGHASSDHRARP